MGRAAVQGAGVPRPGGSYSPGVRIGDLVQTAGQGPVDPATGELVGDTVTEQVRRTMDNVAAVLAAAGGSLADALMMRVYLTRPEDFAEMDAAYATYFTAPAPARTTVFTGLGEGMLVEIDALAVIPER